MKKTLKGYIIGVLSTILLLGTVCYAASNTKTIEALYNNIKIYVDGIKIEPKDANGNTVEPFIYNGTTYLPVRAVGEAIGKTVTWDGATQSVYLGGKSEDMQYLMDVCPPYDGIFKIVSSNKGEYISVAGKKRTDAILFTSKYQVEKMTALFNLDGKYKHLSFKMGRVDDSLRKDVTLNIYLDDKLTKTYELKADGLPQQIEIPLNNALGMKIEIDDTLENMRTVDYAIFDAIIE